MEAASPTTLTVPLPPDVQTLLSNCKFAAISKAPNVSAPAAVSEIPKTQKIPHQLSFDSNQQIHAKSS